MSGALLFVLTILGSVLIWGGYKLRNENIKEYFSGRTGLGILKGIVIVTVLAIIISLIGGCSNVTYFNYASMYAGLEQTKNQSPMCMRGGVDDKTTSNLGFKGNLVETLDKRGSANLKYTHHSCAFSEDDISYDAIGVEAEYKFYVR